MKDIRRHDVFILAKDLNSVIKKGMAGVILEILDMDSFITEFVQSDGTNYSYGEEDTFIIDKSFIEKIIHV